MSDEKQKLNKDGLVAGQEVDFSTLMRIKNKHAKEAAKNGIEQPKPAPKPAARKKPVASKAG